MRDFHSDAGATLTDITMDDLTAINGNFTLTQSNIKTLHFPALTTANALSLDSAAPLNLSLPALVNISWFGITGELSRYPLARFPFRTPQGLTLRV
jgi:hypothetical protein